MQENIELVIFDLDGTLIDSLAGIVDCVTEAANQVGLEKPDAKNIRKGIGLSPSEQVRRLYPELDLTRSERLLQVSYDCFMRGQADNYRLFDGVLETLTDLQGKGYELAIATGMGRGRLNKVLEETGIGQFMRHTMSADDAPAKPSPDMLLQLLTLYDKRADQALMVGDTTYDMQLAENAHVRAIAVSYGAHDRETLANHSPLAILNHLSELTQLL